MINTNARAIYATATFYEMKLAYTARSSSQHQNAMLDEVAKALPITRQKYGVF